MLAAIIRLVCYFFPGLSWVGVNLFLGAIDVPPQGLQFLQSKYEPKVQVTGRGTTLPVAIYWLPTVEATEEQLKLQNTVLGMAPVPIAKAAELSRQYDRFSYAGPRFKTFRQFLAEQENVPPAECERKVQQLERWVSGEAIGSDALRDLAFQWLDSELDHLLTLEQVWDASSQLIITPHMRFSAAPIMAFPKRHLDIIRFYQTLEFVRAEQAIFTGRFAEAWDATRRIYSWSADLGKSEDIIAVLRAGSGNDLGDRLVKQILFQEKCPEVVRSQIIEDCRNVRKPIDLTVAIDKGERFSLLDQADMILRGDYFVPPLASRSDRDLQEVPFGLVNRQRFYNGVNQWADQTSAWLQRENLDDSLAEVEQYEAGLTAVPALRPRWQTILYRILFLESQQQFTDRVVQRVLKSVTPNTTAILGFQKRSRQETAKIEAFLLQAGGRSQD